MIQHGYEKAYGSLGHHWLLITLEASRRFSEPKLLPGVDICTKFSPTPALSASSSHGNVGERKQLSLFMGLVFWSLNTSKRLLRITHANAVLGIFGEKKCEKCEIQRNNLDTATENTEINTKHEDFLTQSPFSYLRGGAISSFKFSTSLIWNHA